MAVRLLVLCVVLGVGGVVLRIVGIWYDGVLAGLILVRILGLVLVVG